MSDLHRKPLSHLEIQNLVTYFFEYKNYRGEVSQREVICKYIWFGTSEYHPEPQFFMHGFDQAKKEHRDFALKDISKLV